MINWEENGYLFDAQTPLWQSRCEGKTYSCFRPHVVYNKQNKIRASKLLNNNDPTGFIGKIL